MFEFFQVGFGCYVHAGKFEKINEKKSFVLKTSFIKLHNSVMWHAINYV